MGAKVVGKACHRLHSSTKRNGKTAFRLPPKLHRVAEEYLPGSHHHAQFPGGCNQSVREWVVDQICENHPLLGVVPALSHHKNDNVRTSRLQIRTAFHWTLEDSNCVADRGWRL